MSKIVIDHLDVEIGMGLLLHDGDAPLPTDVVYRIELPENLFARAEALAQFNQMSRLDRSTWARLVGYELPAGAR